MAGQQCFKIIHRFRNKARKVQFRVIVFFGDMVDNKVRQVLKKIQNVSVLEAFRVLGSNERALLEQAYGEHWYYRIYPSAHVRASLRRIVSDAALGADIKKRLGKDWYDRHVASSQKGGAEAETDAEVEDTELNEDEQVDNVEFLSDIGTPDPKLDTNPEKTARMIEEVIEEDVRQKRRATAWDSSLDNLLNDGDVSQTYTKTYIFREALYPDDSIRTVLRKICATYGKSPAFHDASPYFLPSRLHLWSECQNGTTKMVGKRWRYGGQDADVSAVPGKTIKSYEQGVTARTSVLGLMRVDNEESHLLEEYAATYSTCELFMVDIYNELGQGYAPEADTARKVFENYVRFYYPWIDSDEYRSILTYLDGTERAPEARRINATFETLSNDLLLDREVITVVERFKRQPTREVTFQQPHIIQSIVTVTFSCKTVTGCARLDLTRVLDFFDLSADHPFAQLVANDGYVTYKIFTGQRQMGLAEKWLSTSTPGLNIKVRLPESTRDTVRYLSVNLNENGRLTYKMQWRENEEKTIDDVHSARDVIIALLRKIRDGTPGQDLKMPKPSDFCIVLLNAKQRFALPTSVQRLSHSQLATLASYFHPYVTLVTERVKKSARKARSKSALGVTAVTHLRYKRVSRYDDDASIDKRILHALTNSAEDDQGLASQIAAQLNVTVDAAAARIASVRLKYRDALKRRRLVANARRGFKPPGVGLEVQGSSPDTYVLRITGARSQGQLDAILGFARVFLEVYVRAFVRRDPGFLDITARLRDLTSIAKTREKVDVIVESKTIQSRNQVKQITQLDRERLGFRPERGQNQWTRACQNSGKIRRRPTPFTDPADLKRAGYRLNAKTGLYERRVTVRGRPVTLYAFVTQSTDQDTNVYYTCSPETNGAFHHVGFLTKSLNPYGHCMPCCFKKDPLSSGNPVIRQFNLRCMGLDDRSKKAEEASSSSYGSKLYVLRDSPKLPPGRIAFLPPSLDVFLNARTSKTKRLEGSFLVDSTSGYYLRYGTVQEDEPYLHALCDAIQMESVEKLKRRIAEGLIKHPHKESVFSSLNAGDIKTEYGTVERFVESLFYLVGLSPKIINELIAVPGILTDQGIVSVVLLKTGQANRAPVRLVCSDNDSPLQLSRAGKRQIVMILGDDEAYSPIYLVRKGNREFTVTRTFSTDNPDIVHLAKLHDATCQTLDLQPHRLLTTWQAYKELVAAGHRVERQVLDARHRTKYIVLDSVLFPVLPSRCLTFVPITYDFKPYLRDLSSTLNALETLGDLLPNPLALLQNASGNIVGVQIDTNFSIPVTPSPADVSVLPVVPQPVADVVDEALREREPKRPLRQQYPRLALDDYENEAYQLLRLTLSAHLKANPRLQKQVQRAKDELAVKHLLYQITHPKYLELLGASAGPAGKTIVNVVESMPDLLRYDLRNRRTTCTVTQAKQCDADPHCALDADGSCKLRMTPRQLVTSVNRLADELLNDELKRAELLHIGDYRVSDVVDPERFTNREGQRILRFDPKEITSDNDANVSSANAARVLSQVFGKTSVTDFKRRMRKRQRNPSLEANKRFPLQRVGDRFSQEVAPDHAIYRAFANALHWHVRKYGSPESRNLGYETQQQTCLASSLRARVVDWLQNQDNVNAFQAAIAPITKQPDVVVQNVLSNIMEHDGLTPVLSHVPELMVLCHLQAVDAMVYDATDAPVVHVTHDLRIVIDPSDTEVQVRLRYNVFGNPLASEVSKIEAIYLQPGTQ